MQALLQVSRMIDTVNTWIGRSAAWLILVAVLVSAVNAVVRKLFDMSSNAWLELQWYLFGAVFMLCAAWTLLAREHIRIDIVFSRWSTAGKSRIEMFGHLVFLMPFALLMVWESIPFFIESLRTMEISGNAGGLIIWPTKGVILLGFVLLALQGFSEIVKRTAMMKGLLPDPFEVGAGGHGHAPEPAADKA